MADERRRQKKKPSSIITPPVCNNKLLGHPSRRLAFRIRRRGFTFEGRPSLLVMDGYGVWSVTHRRYIHKTQYHRFHVLHEALHPVRTLVHEQYGMHRWPQYKDDDELRSLRRKVADLYWAFMPEELRATTVRFYRERRAKKLKCCAAAVVFTAVVGFVLPRLLLNGCYSLGFCLILVSAYFLAHLLDKACLAAMPVWLLHT